MMMMMMSFSHACLETEGATIKTTGSTISANPMDSADDINPVLVTHSHFKQP